MKKSVILLMILFLVASLVACGEYTPPIETSKETAVSSTEEGNVTSPEDKVFSVSLVYNGNLYIPTEDITVEWTDGYNVFTAALDQNGVASVTGLDGDYQVTLSSLPEGFSYNPNIHVATNDKSEIEIEIYKLGTASGTGKDLYNSIINLSSMGVYRVELADEEQTVYFQFVPRSSGTYSIESWVDTTAMKLNPMIDIYYGTTAYKVFAYTLDDGGASAGFTKNFRYEVSVDDEEVGNVFAFAVRVTGRGNSAFPASVDFALQLNGSFDADRTESTLQVPTDLYDVMIRELEKLRAMTFDEVKALPLMREANISGKVSEAEYDRILEAQYGVLRSMNFTLDPDADEETEKQRLYRLFAEFWYGIADNAPEQNVGFFRSYLTSLYEGSGSFVGAETLSKGGYVFDGTQYKLNETTGFYHLYNTALYTRTSSSASSRAYAEQYGEGYGPILYASVRSACRFLDLPFTDIEYVGNKALTLANGTENYKHFIEGWSRMALGANGQPGAYCLSGCACSACGGGCLEGCTGCGSGCNPCPLLLYEAPGYYEFCNSDGNFPVTPELKDFLQKYSVSQLLFFDGNGFVETNPDVEVDAMEDDQWLFACGYYLP